jgi:hypothetical protein
MTLKFLLFFIFLLSSALKSNAEITFGEFVNPHPESDSADFGTHVVPLTNGNVVITAPGDDRGANNAGAVFLFNGATGKLISKITGSSVGDRVGSYGVLALPNGNFVIFSPQWRSGAKVDVGAVTWGHGVTGVSGVVSASNSLVGSNQYDKVGSEKAKVVGLSNYVVMSRHFQSVGSGKGAATWCNGNTGRIGYISSANSLVGGRENETVGGFSAGLQVLPNRNYLVFTGNRVGNAITWGNGESGAHGLVSSLNSLTGDSWTSSIPSSPEGVVVLANGNYVVVSPGWDRGSWVDAGAVTWGSADYGVTGQISPMNSLVGTRAYQNVAVSGVVALANGNYLVRSPTWITWCDGTTPRTGELLESDSMVGYINGVSGIIVTLPNGNFLVADPEADTDPLLGVGTAAGAVTWFDGSKANAGVFDPANALVGEMFDRLGSKIEVLSNGNYIVIGPRRATCTWGHASVGVRGVVSQQNSLVCPALYTNTHEAFPLANGNYVVVTSGMRLDVNNDQIGSVTWCNGTTGRIGSVTASNSLLGGQSYDEIGNAGVIPLTNGNYVVLSSLWKNSSGHKVGAATWCRGDGETSGIVSAANSLIGSILGDSEFINGVALPNGNYLVVRPMWDRGDSENHGAVTWCPGNAAFPHIVSVSNSLIGSFKQNLGKILPFESIPPIRILADGDYVVRSPSWSGIGMHFHGALTWGSSTHGVSGDISTANSIIGPYQGSELGEYDIIPLPNGGFIGTIYPKCCVVWNDTDGTRSGLAVPENSLMSPAETSLGMTPVVNSVYQAFYGAATEEANNGKVKVGSFANGGRSVPDIHVEQVANIPLLNNSIVDFGPTIPSWKSTKTIRIHNKGNWPLSLSSLSLSPSDSSPFAINATGTNYLLVAGASTTFTVSFTPGISGSYSRLLQILSNDPETPEFSLELTLTNRQPPVFDGYFTSSWKNASSVIPIWQLIRQSTVPQGGSAVLVSVGPVSLLGGNVKIEGENVIYTPPDVGGNDSFPIMIRDNHGILGQGSVNVERILPPAQSELRTPLVFLYSSSSVGVVLITAPGRTHAVEVSDNLRNWRKLGIFTANLEGKIVFMDHERHAACGFYRLVNP